MLCVLQSLIADLYIPAHSSTQLSSAIRMKKQHMIKLKSNGVAGQFSGCSSHRAQAKDADKTFSRNILNQTLLNVVFYFLAELTEKNIFILCSIWKTGKN